MADSGEDEAAVPLRKFGKWERVRFLRVLAETGSIAAAVAAARVSERAVERARRRNGDFARRCEAEFETHCRRLEERLIGAALGHCPQGDPFNPVMALKVLQLRVHRPAAGEGARANEAVATQAAVDAALQRRLDALDVSRGQA